MTNAVSSFAEALHVAYSHYESDPRPRRLAETLAEAGWKVTVLSLRQPGDSEEADIDGVRVRRFHGGRYRGPSLGAYLRSYLGFLAWAAREGVRRGSHYGLVHVHTPPDFAVLAALPLKWRGAGVLLDIHDLSPELFEERFGSNRRRLGALVRIVERASAATAHQVLTVTEQFERRLVERGIPAAKIHVTMNLPDERIFWRDEIAKPPDSPVLAYHGTLVSRYGVDLLLEAAAQLLPDYPHLQVRIIGDGDQREALMERARRPDLKGRVHFTPGRVPTHQIPEHLAGVTAGVVANRPEGFAGLVLPTKLLEYLALGIPAVVTETAALDHYFEQGELVGVRTPDPAALAEALRPIIDDPTRAIDEVRRARRFFLRHSWRRERQEYLRLAIDLASR